VLTNCKAYLYELTLRDGRIKYITVSGAPTQGVGETLKLIDVSMGQSFANAEEELLKKHPLLVMCE
jgi:GH24 family phage-related lysozyme (muramidase)